jgi:hypothetical protein
VSRPSRPKEKAASPEGTQPQPVQGRSIVNRYHAGAGSASAIIATSLSRRRPPTATTSAVWRSPVRWRPRSQDPSPELGGEHGERRGDPDEKGAIRAPSAFLSDLVSSRRHRPSAPPRRRDRTAEGRGERTRERAALPYANDRQHTRRALLPEIARADFGRHHEPDGPDRFTQPVTAEFRLTLRRFQTQRAKTPT